MTVREIVHDLIDRLPDEVVERIEPDIRRICEENDAVWKALMESPEIDEPLTKDEEEMIRESEQEIERGEYVEWKDIRSEILRES